MFKPEIEIVKFAVEDIITTSTGTEFEQGPNDLSFG